MPILEGDLPTQDLGKLTELAATAGARPEEMGARLLKAALEQQPTGGDLDELEITRAIAGVCADRSPWNNEVDAEWDDWQP